ncbi:MAG: tetratricopeptide repeat protein [Thermoanaerobaculia bacterium]|nr:tetratricopeptide repeat protein [Thermoanaerobaculia bacterium]
MSRLKLANRRARLGRYLVCLALACASGIPLHAQASVGTLQDVWMESLRLAADGSFETASENLERVKQISQQLGVPYYPLYAKSAVGLAREAQLDGNEALQNWAEEAAIELDPLSPEVQFVLADIAKNEGDWGAAATHLLNGVKNVFFKYTASLAARFDLLLTISVAVLLLACAAGVVLTIRYGRQIIHDLRESLSQRFSPGASTVIAFAILFLPLFLWLHPGWLVPYWFVLVFGYASVRERILIVILLVAIALVPFVAAWSAYRLAGARTAVVQASELVHRGAYDPEVSARLSELLVVMPEEPKLHLLAGNIALIEGNQNEALVHYQRAAELDDSFAGAHLNIGNIHFLNGDFPAATVQYERAAELRPEMVAAYFNASVVAGESFNFERQAQQLDLAKDAGRSETNDLLKNPPSRKVYVYKIPYGEIWDLVDEISGDAATRELFGNYATFTLTGSIAHPLTLGALVALSLALIVWMRRRSGGFAGVCVKCGRTFCHRCKSSRESATYCTQCIHIYIKRDGVLSEAKQRKMTEVQQYHKGRLRNQKLLSTVLPGAGNLLEGSTWSGAIFLLLFMVFACVAIFTGRLAPIASPAETMKLALRVVSILGAVLVWFIAVVPVYRAKVRAV